MFLSLAQIQGIESVLRDLEKQGIIMKEHLSLMLSYYLWEKGNLTDEC